MNPFTILETEPFTVQFDRLPPFEKERVEKLINQIREKGNWVGKPLGYLFFREKKFNGSRLYFLVYEEWNTILLLKIGSKKDQPLTIAAIKSRLPEYREYVKQQLMNQRII